MEKATLDKQVRELTDKWRLQCQIPLLLEIWRNESIMEHVFNQEETSCANWIVQIEHDEQQLQNVVNALAEFLQIFQLAITAGPHVLNDIVLGDSCPLASCRCCDGMDLHVTIATKTSMTWDSNDGDIYFRALYEWDLSMASKEFNALRSTLLRYPKYVEVPPISLQLGLNLFRYYNGSSFIIDEAQLQSIRRLRECTESCTNHIGCITILDWSREPRCKIQDLSLWRLQEDVDDIDATCPIHTRNQLSIVLVDGDMSTYLSTSIGKLKMKCGGWAPMVVFASPTEDERKRKRCERMIENGTTCFPLEPAFGHASVGYDGVVVKVWKKVSRVEDLQPVRMKWEFYRWVTDVELGQLLRLVGNSLCQLHLLLYASLRFSQLNIILDQCPHLHELAIETSIDDYIGSNRVPEKDSRNPYLYALQIKRVLPRVNAIDTARLLKDVLLCVGQTLTRLDIKIGLEQKEMDAEFARIIAKMCPNLTALHAGYFTHSFFDALVDAFDQGYLCKVRSLKIYTLSDDADYSVLMALQDPKRAITKCLRSFSTSYCDITFLSTIVSRSSETLNMMNMMLSLNHSLVNVHLWGTTFEKLDRDLVKGTMPLRHMYALMSLSTEFPNEIYKHIIEYSYRPRYRNGIKFPTGKE